MKKILFIIIISSILITISWCGDKDGFKFTFDNFNWSFSTKNTFTINNTKTQWLWSELLADNIVAIYTQTQNTGYTDSIIITKKQTSQNLIDLVSQNLEKIKIDGYSSNKEKTFTIKCDDTKINASTVDSVLKWHLNEIFFTQTFFIYKDFAYIVSFSTDQEDLRDTFTSNIKRINCKTQK